MPAGDLWATLGDTSFVWWFSGADLVPLPDARFTTGGARWRWLPRVAVVSALVYQAAALLRSTRLAAPYVDIVSPLAVPSLATPRPWSRSSPW